jgi:hypothetical protein
MNGLIQSIALGVLRTLAASGAAYLVTHGVMTSNQTDGFVGSVLFLGTLAFSAYDKLAVKAKIAGAAANPTAALAVAAARGLPATMQPIPNPTPGA